MDSQPWRQNASALPVVMGAKTRLGRTLIRQLQARGERPWLIARDTDDARVLAQLHPDLPVMRPEGAPDLAQGILRAHLFICALGPVHPARPSWGDDAAGLTLDIGRVRAVISGLAVPVHAVLVSSVVALAPTRDRAHYAGFKNIVESQLAQVLAHRPRDCLSVVFPGRLTSGRSLLATRYDVLAHRLREMAARSRGRSAVVGWDARLWLLRRVARTTLTALGAGPDQPDLSDRDGGPRQ